MAQPVQRPIGTRDFGPDESERRHALELRLRRVFGSFGYREVQTPTFEDLALFTAKSGPGVVSELYAFKDKGDRDVTLRPELTAPAMRMYFAQHFNDPKPIKWFYFGNCFRYDRPQAGRYREFWQFGCELIGCGAPAAAAELLALADAAVRAAGVRQRDFHVGHVKVLRYAVDCFGFDAEARGRMMRAIDKRDDDEIRRLARSKEGCEGALDRLFLVMDAPTVAAARHALMGEMAAELADLEEALAHLGAMGVADVRLDLGIARGLDYYTGIVFEMHCPLLGAQKQILGGGSYDLSAVFGGQPTATMGFGLGFDRVLVALEAEAAAEGRPWPAPSESGPELYMAALGPAALTKVLASAAGMRAAGRKVEVDLAGRGLKEALKHALGLRARHFVVVGDRDLASGKVQVKELATSQSVEATFDELQRRFGGP